jgi:hypothetical protein
MRLVVRQKALRPQIPLTLPPPTLPSLLLQELPPEQRLQRLLALEVRHVQQTVVRFL